MIGRPGAGGAAESSGTASAPSGATASRLDSMGLWPDAAALPQRLRAALETGRALFGAHVWDLDRGDPVRAVAALGLGTGALAAQSAAAVAEPHLDIPLWVGSGAPTVPAFVGPESLVLAVSCGEGTAAPSAWLREALARGSRLAAVCDEGTMAALRALPALAPGAVLAGGGPAAADGPAGGIGSFATAAVLVLVALSRVGLAWDVAAAVDDAAALLERRHPLVTASDGPAEVLARRIGRTIPLVYGARGIGAVAAHWWKARVNRNAKSPAFWAPLDGAAYDELAGWGQGGDITRQAMTLVLLRHRDEPPQTAALYDAVAAATDEVMADVIEVWAEGGDDLSRLLDLALVGEMVSLHLAAREGVDPGPVPAVDEAQAVEEAAR